MTSDSSSIDDAVVPSVTGEGRIRFWLRVVGIEMFVVAVAFLASVSIDFYEDLGFFYEQVVRVAVSAVVLLIVGFYFLRLARRPNLSTHRFRVIRVMGVLLVPSTVWVIVSLGYTVFVERESFGWSLFFLSIWALLYGPFLWLAWIAHRYARRHRRSMTITSTSTNAATS